jgi:hypothetical protein
MEQERQLTFIVHDNMSLNKIRMSLNFLKGWNFVILIALILLTIIFRLYKIQTPLIEFHSWRQADTMAVSRNYLRDGINLLQPKYDDLSSLQSGLPNPEGYRMVEMPLYNAIVTLTAYGIPFIPIEQIGRLINIFFSSVSVVMIYWLGKKSYNLLAGTIAGLIFATFPFFVFYTRSTLPEVMATTLILIATYIAFNSQKASYTRVSMSFLFFTLAVLTKPTAIFYGIIVFFLFVQGRNFTKRDFALLTAISTFSLLPFVAWRIHINTYPEGIPFSKWLFTQISTGNELVNIFFRPTFFRWVFFERINLLILGSFAFVPIVFSPIIASKKFLGHLLGISTVTYLLVFQGGNVQHEYYQILILPTLAIFCGTGFSYMYEMQKNIFSKVTMATVILVLFVSAWFVSYDRVRHYYYSLSDIPQFARIVQTLTSKDDLIVTDTQGDTTVLYAFDRKGAPAMIGTPEDLKNMGYAYIFTYNQETTDNLLKDYPDIVKTVFRNNRFSLLRL